MGVFSRGRRVCGDFLIKVVASAVAVSLRVSEGFLITWELNDWWAGNHLESHAEAIRRVMAEPGRQ